MSLYFAYGSNMDAVQMRKRCPHAHALGLAKLTGYRLAFTIYSKKRKSGCADVLQSAHSAVYGILYELSAQDLRALDRFEGAPDNYHRIGVHIESHGETLVADTYAVTYPVEGFLPSKQYLDLIVRAAERYGFPEEYRSLLKKIEPQVI